MMNQKTRSPVHIIYITDTVYNTVIHYVVYHVQYFGTVLHIYTCIHTSANAQTNTDTVSLQNKSPNTVYNFDYDRSDSTYQNATVWKYGFL